MPEAAVTRIEPDARLVVLARTLQARDPMANCTFQAMGITAYIKAGGTLERAAAMASHASTQTTQPYDWRAEDPTLDKVERIGVRAHRAQSAFQVHFRNFEA